MKQEASSTKWVAATTHCAIFKGKSNYQSIYSRTTRCTKAENGQIYTIREGLAIECLKVEMAVFGCAVQRNCIYICIAGQLV